MHYQPHLDEQPTTASPSPRHAGVARRFAGAVAAALSAAQARFRRARAGSVLIIVVALLVLIALAGTALIVTARTDRFATGQNIANTQIEMLVDAAVRLTKAQLIEDLFGHNVYRPPTAVPPPPPVNAPLPLIPVPTAVGEYEDYDWPGHDTWLASRTPSISGGVVYWPYVSSPMVIGQSFESPDGGAYSTPRFVSTYDSRNRMEPTFLRIGSESYPAFITYQNGTRIGPFIAADADGDGIADAGLFRLPVGQLNGVTYFVGVRIIDNGAAFNANIHWEPNRNPSTNDPDVPADLFTTNVDLKGALYDGSTTPTPAAWYSNYTPDRQMNQLNAYRAGFSGVVPNLPPAAGPPGNNPPVDDGDPTKVPPLQPYARGDFQWLSAYDQWYHQLARRLNDPGFYAPPSAAYPGGQRFQALSADDATSLAYRFILRNPNSLVASPLEQMLLPTLEFPLDQNRSAGASAVTPRTRTQPYPAPGVSGVGPVPFWYSENFDMFNANGIWARRAVTATSSTVSTAVPFHDMSSLPQEPPLPLRPGGVRVRIYNDTAHKVNIDEAVRVPELMPDPTPSNPADPMPLVPRTNINTAPFGELWRAFWMAMDAPASVERRWDNAHSVAFGAQGIFRSPFRSPFPNNTDTFFDLTNTLLLRAAIAAVNAEDYRDSDTFNASGGGPYNENVTSRRIFLTANVQGRPTPVEVIVFGNEPQPFITEVYVNNDSSEHPLTPPPPAGPPTVQNTKGYVAIELYNPTNETINLRGWHLGVLRRLATQTGTAPAYPKMLVMPLGNFAGFSATPSPFPRVLLPGERYLLENYNQGVVDAGDPNAAQYRPRAVELMVASIRPEKRFYVRDLHAAIGDGAEASGELVLLRPRRGDGQSMTDQANGINELGRNPTSSGLLVNLDELVPLDSFDFTGIKLVAPPGAGGTFPAGTVFTEMHYVRQNDDSPQNHWKCVYPGDWRESQTDWRQGTNLNGIGVKVATFTPGSESPWATAAASPPITLGAADTSGSTYENPYPPIQLNSGESAGPNKMKSAQNHYPFGGFARNGDILQVPYIGAYTIRTMENAQVGRPAVSPAGTPPSRAIILEMNTVSWDSSKARDDLSPTDPNFDPRYRQDDAFEMIGRFCPLIALTRRYDPTNNSFPHDASGNVIDPYGWAADLFDYLTVDAPHGYDPDADTATTAQLRPHGDFLPNVKPSNYGTWGTGPGVGGRPAFQALPRPRPVKGNDSPPAVKGQINLNTAPARVIAALNMWSFPFKDDGSIQGSIANNGVDDRNEQLANMIVRWRDGDPANGIPPRGPFRNLYDLNRVFDVLDPDPVTIKRFQFGGVLVNTDDPNYNPVDRGDITPRNGDDKVVGDFEAPFLMMNRISNLVTTRSDSYTVYIVVQGWRGVGTNNPTLVVQRRAAYLADRSGVSQSDKDLDNPPPVFVPTN